MSIKTYVKYEEKLILSYLKTFLGMPGQKPEDFVECTSQKIGAYVQEVFEDIKKAVKEKTSKGEQCFSIEKKIFCHKEILEIIYAIFSNYQISLGKEPLSSSDAEDTYFDLMSPIKLKTISPHQNNM